MKPTRRQVLLKVVLTLTLTLILAPTPLSAQFFGPARNIAPSTFANLGAPANGAVRYCTDCTAGAPCTGSGTGQFAVRVAGAWNCSNGSGGGAATFPLLATDGSAAAPSYSFTNNSNMGWFRSANNLLGVTVAGTEFWDFNGSGGFNCAVDGNCVVGNGAADPQSISVRSGGLTVRGATSGSALYGASATGGNAVAGKVTLTAPATGSTLTILNGKTLTANNTLTLAGTDSTVMTFPSTSAAIARTDAAQTFQGDQSFSAQVLGKVANAPTSVAFGGVGSTNAGLYFRAAGTSNIASSGLCQVDFASSLGLLLTTAAPTVAFTGSSTCGSGGRTAITEVASGVMGISAGSAGASDGWLVYAGHTRVNADVTNATATMAAITGLTATLKAGRKYTGQMDVKCNDSVAAEGIQFDFGGGTATMTSFWAGASDAVGSSVLGTTIATTLTGAMNFSTLTGENIIHITFSLVANGAGTLIPRFAQNSHTAGTATAELGSFMWVEDTP